MNDDHNPTSLDGASRGEALFRSWFVDYDPVRERLGKGLSKTSETVAALFPNRMEDGEWSPFEVQADARFPAGWTHARLSHAVLIVQGTGLSIPKGGAGADGVPLVTLSDLPERGWVLDSPRRLSQAIIEESKLKLLPRGATLMSNESSNLRCVLAGTEIAFNRSMVGCRAKNDYPDYFTHFLLRFCHRELMRWCLMSGCRYRLDQRHFDEFRVVLPPSGLAIEFDSIVGPWMEYDLRRCHH